jgi:hypothetical protein
MKNKIDMGTFNKMAINLVANAVVEIHLASNGEPSGYIQCAMIDDEVYCTDCAAYTYKVTLDEWKNPMTHTFVHWENRDFIRGLPMEEFTLAVDYPVALEVKPTSHPEDVLADYKLALGDD